MAQVAYGASVALVYSVFLLNHKVYGLFMALVIVCVARGLGMYLLACLRSPQSATRGTPGPEQVRPSPATA